jgi:hypothetical protein
VSEQTTGKGRPTPKRSEAQKRRGGPVAPPPTNRREAAKQLRAKQADGRKRIREGSLRGDEKLMLKRDQGPVRKLVRDLVDSRRTLGWILLPLAVIVVIAGFFGPAASSLAVAVWMAAMFAVAVDMVFIGFGLSKAIQEAFPDEPKWKGHIRYGLMRTIQMRRLRVPRPSVGP